MYSRDYGELAVLGEVRHSGYVKGFTHGVLTGVISAGGTITFAWAIWYFLL